MNYGAWRATFQSSEQAARAAFNDCAEAHRNYVEALHFIALIREAIGDDGKMMQSELVEHLKSCVVLNPSITSADKARLIGEHKFTIEGGSICPECYMSSEPSEDCEICHGECNEGGYTDLVVTVPWDIQKQIIKDWVSFRTQKKGGE